MKYFISFKWMDKNYQQYPGEFSGHTVMELTSPITSEIELSYIIDAIKRQNDRIWSVAIVNWKRMEMPE